MVIVAEPGVGPLAVRTSVPPRVAVWPSLGPVVVNVPVRLAATATTCGRPVLKTTKSFAQLGAALTSNTYFAGNCPAPTVPTADVLGNDIAQSRRIRDREGLGFSWEARGLGVDASDELSAGPRAWAVSPWSQ